jgi:hypothetical protein
VRDLGVYVYLQTVDIKHKDPEKEKVKTWKKSFKNSWSSLIGIVGFKSHFEVKRIIKDNESYT